MAKFNRVLSIAFLGAGDTNEEANENIVARAQNWVRELKKGKRDIDVGVQTLYEGDPGGGGPCAPQKLDVAEVILVVPLPEAQSRDD